VAAVIGARENPGFGKSAWIMSTILSVISCLCVQTATILARSMPAASKHVLSGPVAEIDLEAELRGGPDPIRGLIDDCHIRAAGKQDLRSDLAKTRKPDHQHVGTLRRRNPRPSDRRLASCIMPLGQHMPPAASAPWKW
jgi:hypothetical protein